LTFATVSALERGRTAPMFATVRAIARALDVSMAELGAAIDAQD
jgi:transcriptional regulator with XRE-family HTH domain